MQYLRLSVFAFLFVCAALTGARAEPATLSRPVAPPLAQDGTGLCSATAQSQDVNNDFGQLNAATFSNGINTFIESKVPASLVVYVVRTLLDLSNNNAEGSARSFGDFEGAVPDCPDSGCPFPILDTTTAFGSRLRGFLNVTADMVGPPIHIGLYADDAVSITFFEDGGGSREVLVQQPVLGTPTFRLTETVIFQQPGLYPVEILYVEIAEHAALEFSYIIGDPTDPRWTGDFQRPSDTDPVFLDEVGFLLFPADFFFQAISGAPSFPDPDQCQQCSRQFAGVPSGDHGCPQAYYCNEAALCAPCDTALFCGPSCSPCGAATPFCVNVNERYQCVECGNDDHCPTGFVCADNACVPYECGVDSECSRDELCINNVCQSCNRDDQCAGNSCNCCPVGSTGGQMQCRSLAAGEEPVCVECLGDENCTGGRRCDLVTGQCVQVLTVNRRFDCCGDDCVQCPDDLPYCLASDTGGAACAECRSDVDCPDGAFCMSGQCLPCVRDRRCGLRCESCGGDTPFCDGGDQAAQALCVGCRDNADCGEGEQCNAVSKSCEPAACAMSCAEATPYCHGGQCVQCFADTQCPCGGTCDLESFTCSTSCRNNLDCLGATHCRWDDAGEARECAPGRMPNTDQPCKDGEVATGAGTPTKVPGGLAGEVPLAAPCRRLVPAASSGCSVGAGPDPGPPWALVLLALAAALGLGRRRRHDDDGQVRS
ncbi:outer membrane exchange protein TraA family protein [Haliangium sp.]|uniref:outer membrane exchange protein TraA family protein n=1 Tax=Haliangium sp. TaxID=2663208 RepID=UPI003D11135D